MSLSSLQLDAFVSVAKAQSFSGGAKMLNITQSALSQRILNLESELGSTLFIREPAGIRLTELGQKMLRYCRVKDSLEEELLGQLHIQKNSSLSGLVRMGGISTVVRSVLIPSVSPIIDQNPDVQVEFLTKEVRQLPTLLETGEADFILLNKPYEKQGVENIDLGFEENVLVEPKNIKFREDVYLDHDANDTTTSDFFEIQKKSPKILKRSYFDEIYTIIDGVLAGAGRAVIPLHLAKQIEGVKIVKGLNPLKTPIFLCYYKQGYYTSLQKQVIYEITHRAPKFLK